MYMNEETVRKLERVKEMIGGMNFDELMNAFNKLNEEVVNPDVNDVILDRMEEVDEPRFIDWMLKD